MSGIISATSPYLLENGPVYSVIITPSFPTIETLRLERKDVPHIKGQALFDTGAQTTAISERVSSFLKLVPRGTAKVYTSQSSKIVNKYDIARTFAFERRWMDNWLEGWARQPRRGGELAQLFKPIAHFEFKRESPNSIGIRFRHVFEYSKSVWRGSSRSQHRLLDWSGRFAIRRFHV